MARRPETKAYEVSAKRNGKSVVNYGTDHSKVNISCWGIQYQQAYFDVRVFNPLATSNHQSAISTCFQSHNCEKRRVYEQRVRDVERGSFTSLSSLLLAV